MFRVSTLSLVVIALGACTPESPALGERPSNNSTVPVYLWLEWSGDLDDEALASCDEAFVDRIEDEPGLSLRNTSSSFDPFGECTGQYSGSVLSPGCQEAILSLEEGHFVVTTLAQTEAGWLAEAAAWEPARHGLDFWIDNRYFELEEVSETCRGLAEAFVQSLKEPPAYQPALISRVEPSPTASSVSPRPRSVVVPEPVDPPPAIAAPATRAAEEVDPTSQSAPIGGDQTAERFRIACEGGLWGACVEWGWLFEHGIGVVREPARARALYFRAAQNNHPGGLFLLGRANVDNPPNSIYFWQLGCVSGSMIACSTLSDDHLEPERLGQDFDFALTSEARRLRLDQIFAQQQQGCSVQGGEACMNAANLVNSGIGTGRDDAVATRYYVQACEVGVARSCIHAAYMYYRGLGVGGSVTRYTNLLEQACTLDGSTGCVYRDGQRAARRGIVVTSPTHFRPMR